MLITHHWLGFILLAVLVSPACAAPMQSTTAEHSATVGHSSHSTTTVGQSITVKYKVTVLGEDGNALEKVPRLTGLRVEKIIRDIGKKLGDDPEHSEIHPQSLRDDTLVFNDWGMIYFQLEGAKFCVGICYGYTVKASKRYPQLVGGVVTQVTQGRCVIVHKPLPKDRGSINIANFVAIQQRWQNEFLEFLKTLVLLGRWASCQVVKEGTQDAKDAYAALAAAERLAAAESMAILSSGLLS
ncbi:hypothetical protein BDP27DRAFT_1340233 [Rhodocollybia butyracea]|uniref:Uncharacterized protein n=1 Tax=Rhodocollybia butyracea TaxID=206335 RepID=A0A9P5U014_9AGAR|nr:hypothetical protein BDP27DRAFT_1340233 [Rhodocollybia butyracea]